MYCKPYDTPKTAEEWMFTRASTTKAEKWHHGPELCSMYKKRIKQWLSENKDYASPEQIAISDAWAAQPQNALQLQPETYVLVFRLQCHEAYQHGVTY